MQVRLAWLIPLLVLTLLIWSVSLDNGFVWDDHILVEKNQHNLAAFSLQDIFLSDFWSTETEEGASHYYRPFITVSYCLDYLVGGLDPKVFHLTNIIVHTVIVVLVWLLLLEMGIPLATATLATAVFAVHPTLAESVAWISGRTDLIATVFMLLSIVSCVYGFRSKKPTKKLQWVSVIACAAALLSKESAVVTPALALIFCLSLSGSSKKIDRILRAFIVLIGGWILLRLLILGSVSGVGESEGVSFTIGILSLLHVWGNLLWPPLFRIEYGSTLTPATLLPGALVGVLALGIALIGAFRQKTPKHIKTLSRCALIAFIPSVLAVLLRSMIGVRLIYTTAAFYLPAIVISLLAWSESKRTRGYIVAVVALLSLGTLSRESLWTSDSVLFTEALKAKDASTRNHLNLGIALYNSGDLPSALEELSHPMELAAQDQQHYMLSLIYTGLGCERDAERELRAAIAVKPDNYSASHNLAGLFATQGRLKESRALLEEFSRRHPTYRARAMQQLKLLENMPQVQQRLPSNPPACTDAGIMATFLATPLDLNRRAGELLKNQQSELAEVLVKAALRVDPNFVAARLNLAQVYILQKNLPMARQTVQTVLDLNPGEERARSLLRVLDSRM